MNLILNSVREYKRDWARNNQKTVLGYAKKVYARQRNACKTRNMAMPSYSIEDFIEWLLGNPKFIELFNSWLNSGDRLNKPSIDRIDDRKTYSFGNIQATTIYDNLYIKGQLSRIAGRKAFLITPEGKASLKNLADIGKVVLHREHKIFCQECGGERLTRSAKARFCSRKCEQINRRRRQK